MTRPSHAELPVQVWAKVMVVLSWQTTPTLWERGGERDFFYPSTPVCQHFSAGKHALEWKKTVHADKGG